MQPKKSFLKEKRGCEEDVLAILDSGCADNTRDIHEDRLAFLEAVRFVSLASDKAPVTWKMHDAIFHIFRTGASLDEIMISYQLLFQLEKLCPRLSLANKEKPGSTLHELVVAKEAWLPFGGSILNMYTGGTEVFQDSKNLLDAPEFCFLTHEISQASGAIEFGATLQVFKELLLYHYLIHVLHEDFQFRETIYKETMNWVYLRESLLSLILGSRKINVRNFIQDCIDIVSTGFLCHKNADLCNHVKRMKTEAVEDSCDLSILHGTLEMGKKTVDAIEKLFSLIICYDIHRKEADLRGDTSRADAVRVPLIEMIVDHLSYSKDGISPFLVAFSKPEWKLEIIVQYLRKYCGSRTRQSNSSFDNSTFEGILKCFGDVRSVKGLARKMPLEDIKLLLAHGFQAYISTRCERKLLNSTEGVVRDDSILQVSKDLICAFENISHYEGIQLSAFEKEALCTAGALLTLESQT